MNNQYLRIGKITIKVPRGHSLPYIYDTRPNYQYLPWRRNQEIIKFKHLEDFSLLDLGANIGDSAAHFRNISAAPIYCVEPVDHFFDFIMQRFYVRVDHF